MFSKSNMKSSIQDNLEKNDVIKSAFKQLWHAAFPRDPQMFAVEWPRH